MAEEPLLGLFDTETGFLDELAGQSTDIMASGMGGAGAIGMAGSHYMQQGAPGGHMMSGDMQAMYRNEQMPSAGYQQQNYAAAMQSQYGGMGSNGPEMQQHMGAAMVMNPAQIQSMARTASGQTMMQARHTATSPQQQGYASPPPGSQHYQRPAPRGYPGYTSNAVGPRMPNPALQQQHITLMQQQQSNPDIWNQNQAAMTNMGMVQHGYTSGQQPPQQLRNDPLQQMSYMAQQPVDQTQQQLQQAQMLSAGTQRLTHYSSSGVAAQTIVPTTNGGGGVQRLRSPPVSSSHESPPGHPAPPHLSPQHSQGATPQGYSGIAQSAPGVNVGAIYGNGQPYSHQMQQQQPNPVYGSTAGGVPMTSSNRYVYPSSAGEKYPVAYGQSVASIQQYAAYSQNQPGYPGSVASVQQAQPQTMSAGAMTNMTSYYPNSNQLVIVSSQQGQQQQQQGSMYPAPTVSAAAAQRSVISPRGMSAAQSVQNSDLMTAQYDALGAAATVMNNASSPSPFSSSAGFQADLPSNYNVISNTNRNDRPPSTSESYSSIASVAMRNQSTTLNSVGGIGVLFSNERASPSLGGLSGSIPNIASPSFPSSQSGPLSPAYSGQPPVMNVNVEVQHLQQQIQHLYNMPQTQQTQQQMLDLQEHVRILKAQQLMQMQRQQQTTPHSVSSQPASVSPVTSPQMAKQVAVPQSISEFSPGTRPVIMLPTTPVSTNQGGQQQQLGYISSPEHMNVNLSTAVPGYAVSSAGPSSNILPSLSLPDSVEDGPIFTQAPLCIRTQSASKYEQSPFSPAGSVMSATSAAMTPISTPTKQSPGSRPQTATPLQSPTLSQHNASGSETPLQQFLPTEDSEQMLDESSLALSDISDNQQPNASGLTSDMNTSCSDALAIDSSVDTSQQLLPDIPKDQSDLNQDTDLNSLVNDLANDSSDNKLANVNSSEDNPQCVKNELDAQQSAKNDISPFDGFDDLFGDSVAPQNTLPDASMTVELQSSNNNSANLGGSISAVEVKPDLSPSNPADVSSVSRDVYNTEMVSPVSKEMIFKMEMVSPGRELHKIEMVTPESQSDGNMIPPTITNNVPVMPPGVSSSFTGKPDIGMLPATDTANAVLRPEFSAPAGSNFGPNQMDQHVPQQPAAQQISPSYPGMQQHPTYGNAPPNMVPYGQRVNPCYPQNQMPGQMNRYSVNQVPGSQPYPHQQGQQPPSHFQQNTGQYPQSQMVPGVPYHIGGQIPAGYLQQHQEPPGMPPMGQYAGGPTQMQTGGPSQHMMSQQGQHGGGQMGYMMSTQQADPNGGAMPYQHSMDPNNGGMMMGPYGSQQQPSMHGGPPPDMLGMQQTPMVNAEGKRLTKKEQKKEEARIRREQRQQDKLRRATEKAMAKEAKQQAKTAATAATTGNVFSPNSTGQQDLAQLPAIAPSSDVFDPATIPSTVEEMLDGTKKSPKKKRKPKDPNKEPKSPKTPRMPKDPNKKEKKKRSPKSKPVLNIDGTPMLSESMDIGLENNCDTLHVASGQDISCADEQQFEVKIKTDIDDLGEDGGKEDCDDIKDETWTLADADSSHTAGEDKRPKSKKGKTPKRSKTTFLKAPRPSRKRPPATFLKNKKRKRRLSASDVDITPHHSAKEESNEELSVQKRRSGRNMKRKKYNDDVALNFSDDESLFLPLPLGDGDDPLAQPLLGDVDTIVVQKILGVRLRKMDKDDVDEKDDEEKEPEPDEDEYYVKYKNYSYLHCEWRTANELDRDKRIHLKIRRFQQKRQQQLLIFAEMEDEEMFNPDYVEVDRVLDMSVANDPVTEEETTHFLVKWRGLNYEDSTWELQQDVDPAKVEAFLKVRTLPPEEDREYKERPKNEEWEQTDDIQGYKGGNTLREYQLEGVNWLTFSWYNSRNCILADEMGLGKTIQSIAFLLEMFNYGIRGPFLIIAPLSTIANWQREFETWTDMNVIVYHGSNASRNMLQEYEMYYKDERSKKLYGYYRFHAIITTYEIIITDWELLSKIYWRCCIIDEAHRLKNRNCKLLEGLKMFDLEHRVLLTGTPLQNNVDELFSLLNFLEPLTFDSEESFIADFGELKTDDQVQKLQAILKPLMLRRLKEDVEKNLAPKEETIVEVELTNIQKKYYRAILERNVAFLSKGSGTNANMPNLMNTMMQLRKCCNHPYLIDGAEEKIMDEARDKHGNGADISFRSLVQSSGKLVLIDKLLPRLKEGGHRVLIFSQMIRVLDIIEDYCITKKYLYERLDGRITGGIRQEAIDRFSKPDSDRFVFLLCTRAGGLGINLTAADTVIIYDSDWNPQNDLQAQARCHRIGQSRAVKVYRIVTRNTYEREMFDRASMKLGLDKAVLQSACMGGETKAVNQQSGLSKTEVEELLRTGAYGALLDDDTAGDKFCEEDIDIILERRTQIIQVETEGKGSTFSKASFNAADNRNDISIDDPDFWQKWAKKADIDMDQLNNGTNLIVEEPRQRKQTTRYGNQDRLLENMSELESSSDSDFDNKPKTHGNKKRLSKRKKNRDAIDEDFDVIEEMNEGKYHRADFFAIEKMLLIYGWGRWQDILLHGQFKRKLTREDVETISKAILILSLWQYHGDDRIKEFIWDLISADGMDMLKNHSGLSAPVPRGRKGRKMKEKSIEAGMVEMERSNILIDPEEILSDAGFRKHLIRQSNKILLRVRLLYYLKQEVIGDQTENILQGTSYADVDMEVPIPDGDPPAPWWDMAADKSLLMGTFKHGYERFNAMRQDPMLSFLALCGPPDGAAVLAEQNDLNMDDIDDKPNETIKDDIDEIDEEASADSTLEFPKDKDGKTPSDEEEKNGEQEMEEGEVRLFPSVSDLNARMRRLITAYQRNHKRLQLKMAQNARRLERREKTEAMRVERREKTEALVKERLMKRIECQQNKWTRREESEFYRAVSTFGVEYNHRKGCFNWDRFRSIAKLDKKYDDSLLEYYMAFLHMCKRVCRRFREGEDTLPAINLAVEPITEERAGRCLNRIELLSKIREEILSHSQLDERLKLCQPAFDLPDWWICGKHDKDLLIGAARHGLARTDYHILHDPTLSFAESMKSGKRSDQFTALRLQRMKEMMQGIRRDDDEDDDFERSLYSNMDTPSKDHHNHTDSEMKAEQVEPVKKDMDDGINGYVKGETTDENTDDHDKPNASVTKDVVNKDEDDKEESKPPPDLDVKPDMDVEMKPLLDESGDPPDLSDTQQSKASPSKEEITDNDESKLIIKKEEELDSEPVKEEVVCENVKSESPSDLPEKASNDDKELIKTEVKSDVELTENDNEKVCDIKEDGNARRKDEETDLVQNGDDETGLVKTESEVCSDKDDKPLDIPSKPEVKEEKTGEEDKDDEKEKENSDVKEHDKDVVSEKKPEDSSELVNEGGDNKEADVKEEAKADLMNKNEFLVQALENAARASPFSLDMDGNEATVADLLARAQYAAATQWPKDKVIFHRLEHIAHCVDKGEWPFPRRPLLTESRSTTPVGPATPKSDLTGEYNSTSDAPDSATEGGVKQKRRGRRRKIYMELEEEKAKLRELLNKNLSGTGAAEDTPPHEGGKRSQPPPAHSGLTVTPQQQLPDVMLNGELEPGEIRPLASMGYGSYDLMQKRRGRKRKIDTPNTGGPEAAALIAEAEAKRQAIMEKIQEEAKRQAMIEKAHQEAKRQSLLEQVQTEAKRRTATPDKPHREQATDIRKALHHRSAANKRIDKTQQEILAKLIQQQGADMPFAVKRDLQTLLKEQQQQQSSQQQQNTKPSKEAEESEHKHHHKHDPSQLTKDMVSSDENVSVIHRETGEKITGAKAPPLKYLAEWLEKNTGWDVDPKWAELVRAKATLPKMVESRINQPSEKRRGRPRNTNIHPALLGAGRDMPYSMAGLSALAPGMLPGFPKMPLGMPFGGLPNFPMPNPLFGRPGFDLPGHTSTAASTSTTSSMSSSKLSRTKESGDNGGKAHHSMAGSGEVKTSSSHKERHGSGTSREVHSSKSLSSSKSKSPALTSASSSSPLSSFGGLMPPHPSFPLLYNPLFYNSLLAAQGLRNLPLPPGLPANFAALAQMDGLPNGFNLEQMQAALEREMREKAGKSLRKEPPPAAHSQKIGHTKESLLREVRHSEQQASRHKDSRHKNSSSKVVPAAHSSHRDSAVHLNIPDARRQRATMGAGADSRSKLSQLSSHEISSKHREHAHERMSTPPAHQKSSSGHLTSRTEQQPAHQRTDMKVRNVVAELKQRKAMLKASRAASQNKHLVGDSSAGSGSGGLSNILGAGGGGNRSGIDLSSNIGRGGTTQAEDLSIKGHKSSSSSSSSNSQAINSNENIPEDLSVKSKKSHSSTDNSSRIHCVNSLTNSQSAARNDINRAVERSRTGSQSSCDDKNLTLKKRIPESTDSEISRSKIENLANNINTPSAKSKSLDQVLSRLTGNTGGGSATDKLKEALSPRIQHSDKPGDGCDADEEAADT